MAIRAHTEDPGLFVVRISGVLQLNEVAEAQNTALEIIREHGTLSALILLDQFEGWERSGSWGDLTLLTKLDSYTAKIAIVGQERWRDEMLMFEAAGLRQSEVRYFDDEVAARAWLPSWPCPSGRLSRYSRFAPMTNSPSKEPSGALKRHDRHQRVREEIP